jgi:hypothetical protein
MFVGICSIVIAIFTTLVFAGEAAVNKDLTDLRMNITIIMKDIEENCTNLLKKYPHIKNLPIILPVCWRLHDSYRHAKIVVTILIIHDSLCCYLVSGGPVAYFFMSAAIGFLSILGVYLSQMGLLLIIDCAYIIYGFTIFIIAFNKCFTALPPERLYTS